MITAKHHEHLIETINGLSELEMDELLRGISEVLYRNKMEHLIDNHFEVGDEISGELYEVKEERDNLERQVEQLEADLSRYKKIIMNIKNELPA